MLSKSKPKSHNVIPVVVLLNSTDKLKLIDVSVNKPLKDHVKCKFLAWYLSEVQHHILYYIVIRIVSRSKTVCDTYIYIYIYILKI